MTMIAAASYFSTTQRYSGAERSTPNANFPDQAEQETAQPSNGQSSRLTELLAQADALKKQQLGMSNTDYLLAKFGIEEQIATERLNAGENLDRYAVRVEGRVFNLAGKMYGSDILKAANSSDIGMVKLATVEDHPLLSMPQNGLASSRRGVDISA